MKHVASLILVAGLCACTGRPEDTGAANGPTSAASAPATDASSKADHASAAQEANAEPAAPTPDSASPADHQGIAVGEPNPSAPGGLHTSEGTPGNPNTAQFNGYAGMTFGMDEPTARTAYNGPGELNGKVGSACTYLNVVKASNADHLAFMFEGGKFVRYDVSNDRDVAPGGGRRGMSADTIRRLYSGRLTEMPHKYVEGGKYLKVTGDGGAVVFETDAKGVVTEWHAGVAPQVDYIEGCS